MARTIFSGRPATLAWRFHVVQRDNENCAKSSLCTQISDGKDDNNIAGIDLLNIMGQFYGTMWAKIRS